MARLECYTSLLVWWYIGNTDLHFMDTSLSNIGYTSFSLSLSSSFLSFAHFLHFLIFLYKRLHFIFL